MNKSDFRSALMHMLCLITYKVRSENGYGFLRPGSLKTSVENDIFSSEIGSGFGDAGGTPTPKIPRSTPPGTELACMYTKPLDKIASDHSSVRLVKI